MVRALIGACIGAVAGVLVLAGFGFWAGYTEGGEASARPALPPGWEAALTAAFVYAAYFWWFAATVGGLIGGLAGLGSWLVRPRPAARPGVPVG